MGEPDETGQMNEPGIKPIDEPEAMKERFGMTGRRRTDTEPTPRQSGQKSVRGDPGSAAEGSDCRECVPKAGLLTVILAHPTAGGKPIRAERKPPAPSESGSRPGLKQKAGARHSSRPGLL